MSAAVLIHYCIRGGEELPVWVGYGFICGGAGGKTKPLRDLDGKCAAARPVGVHYDSV